MDDIKKLEVQRRLPGFGVMQLLELLDKSNYNMLSLEEIRKEGIKDSVIRRCINEKLIEQWADAGYLERPPKIIHDGKLYETTKFVMTLKSFELLTQVGTRKAIILFSNNLTIAAKRAEKLTWAIIALTSMLALLAVIQIVILLIQ